jgi:hypothetical protein
MEFDDSIKNTLNQTNKSAMPSIIKTPDTINKIADNVLTSVPLLTNEEIKIDMLTQKSIKDSKCTRFVRKKFVCIIIFLLFLIAMLEFFTTLTDKLSENHLSDIFILFSNILNKHIPIEVYVNDTTKLK